ncbi:hypothetical protein AVU99_gp059 [Mycobacterium phage Lolly9]|uniref:Uncharacterized protein n=1 Tax=Mycobacterium phage Lolly9 TaxID=1698711 RepID=A0A0K2FP20_9CAUD|nr:hypothetical protein AVU99_gp059 [Mycobacterium phage Lolly9]ALA48538.1 hypothetical protein LOLLY9_131 [Mycobacterium phage Lolly9]QOP65847.1 membrane protein [Mycobacterium phage MiniLon]
MLPVPASRWALLGRWAALALLGAPLCAVSACVSLRRSWALLTRAYARGSWALCSWAALGVLPGDKPSSSVAPGPLLGAKAPKRA